MELMIHRQLYQDQIYDGMQPKIVHRLTSHHASQRYVLFLALATTCAASFSAAISCLMPWLCAAMVDTSAGSIGEAFSLEQEIGNQNFSHVSD